MSCDPALFPIKIRRGIHYGPLTITCNDSNDTPVDISGFGVFAVGRPETESPTLVDLQPEITDGPGGVVTIDLDDADTLQFPVGDYVWDLVLENLDSERIGPFLAGPLTIIDTVSRE